MAVRPEIGVLTLPWGLSLWGLTAPPPRLPPGIQIHAAGGRVHPWPRNIKLVTLAMDGAPGNSGRKGDSMGLHIAFVANNNTNSLLTTYSGNGKNWGGSTPVGSESSKQSPAMAFASSGPQGFTLGFVANDASNQLLVSHSADGVTWKPNTAVQNQSSKAAPALAVFENKLWIAFVANDASNQLLVSSSADGVTWKPNTPVQNQSRRQRRPWRCSRTSCGSRSWPTMPATSCWFPTPPTA